MAGEYVRWLARDVKPMEKKELTPQEKRRNWWEYHKWYVAAAVLGLILVWNLVSGVVENIRSKPDYTIAYVGSTHLPEELALALETAIAGQGEDLNGNGEVRAELVQYRIHDESAEEDPDLWQQAYSDSMQLTSNIEMTETVIYLLETPELFDTYYPVLCRTDGTDAEEDSDAPLYYLWKDCPVLAGLPMGSFSLSLEDGSADIDCQMAMANIAVARRGLWGDGLTERNLGAVRLFEALTAGAAE